jgi:hypothetical protein
MKILLSLSPNVQGHPVARAYQESVIGLKASIEDLVKRNMTWITLGGISHKTGFKLEKVGAATSDCACCQASRRAVASCRHHRHRTGG